MTDSIYWSQFYNKIDKILKDTLDNNIIIFGSSQGSEFIRWFYLQFYNKNVKFIIDRWKVDNHYSVLHLMSFYYVYDKDDIIINTYPKEMGPVYEFKNIGEDWSNVVYSENQIINLWDKLYNTEDLESTDKYDITFYDYLEYTQKVDLLTTIRRSCVKGNNAHGYYPADFRIIYTIFKLSDHFRKDDYLLDIGCGKGASLIALYECGFKNLGGVEYTDQIYSTLIRNMEALKIDYKEDRVNNDFIAKTNTRGGVFEVLFRRCFDDGIAA